MHALMQACYRQNSNVTKFGQKKQTIKISKSNTVSILKKPMYLKSGITSDYKVLLLLPNKSQIKKGLWFYRPFCVVRRWRQP